VEEAAMTMAKQISKATQAAKDSQGTKKRTGRKPTYVVTLSDEDKELFTSVIAKRSAPAVHVTRAEIALLANEHVRLRDIADELDISLFTVSKWVGRFALYGVRSLGDAPRPGVPRTHGDDKIAEIIKMNQVERWFSALATKYLQRSVHHSVAKLNRGIAKWAKAQNENPKPFIWTKSADEIFASLQRYLATIVSPQTSEEGR